jgi:hypothetical protein
MRGYTEAMHMKIKTQILLLVAWPLRLVLRWGYEKFLLQTFDAIKICDIASADDTEQQLFCCRTLKALELIKENDPRRYRRIQRHLVYIINCRTLLAGEYSSSLRSCDINVSHFNFEDEDFVILMLACTFIHEATHGRIFAYHIPYDTEHRLRVECLCHQEEVRFARRVMPDVDLGEYDESGHQAFYQRSRWRYAMKSLRYIIQPDQLAP